MNYKKQLSFFINIFVVLFFYSCLTIEVEKYKIDPNIKLNYHGKIKIYRTKPLNRKFLKIAKIKIRDFSSRINYQEIKEKILPEIQKLSGHGAYFVKKRQTRNYSFMLDTDGKAGKHPADKNNMVYVEAIIFIWQK